MTIQVDQLQRGMRYYVHHFDLWFTVESIEIDGDDVFIYVLEIVGHHKIPKDKLVSVRRALYQRAYCDEVSLN